MAHVTPGFSFAFLQECFVATLLILAREDVGLERLSLGGDLDDYVLWRVFKQQADELRKQIKSDASSGEEKMLGQPLSSLEPPSGIPTSDGEPSSESTGKGRGDGMLPALPGGKVRIINPAAFALV